MRGGRENVTMGEISCLVQSSSCCRFYGVFSADLFFIETDTALSDYEEKLWRKKISFAVLFMQ